MSKARILGIPPHVCHVGAIGDFLPQLSISGRMQLVQLKSSHAEKYGEECSFTLSDRMGSCSKGRFARHTARSGETGRCSSERKL